MRISKPFISVAKDKVIYQAKVKTGKAERILWYSIDKEFGHLISTSSDAALIGLLIPAMASGKKIYLDGSVSEKLYFQASCQLQSALECNNALLKRVSIKPKQIERHQRIRIPAGVATGFSGGVDSFSTLLDHLNRPDRFRLSHLIFSNVGSHGSAEPGERLFNKRFERLSAKVKDRIRLPFVRINSNLDSFYREDLRFRDTHTLRNASVALLLQRGIGTFLYASAYSYRQILSKSARNSDIALLDPIILPNLSTPMLTLLPSGSEYSRVQKTLRISEYHHSYDMLDVCTSSAHSGKHLNCSQCSKCLRTMATLEIGEMLYHYSRSFDLSAYAILRGDFFRSLKGSSDPFLQEIESYAADKSFVPKKELGICNSKAY